MLVEIKDTSGKVVAVIMVNPKIFSTGSRGYHASTKVEIEGKRYQANIMFVEIGSKPQS
jgi:hypothetical protein